MKRQIRPKIKQISLFTCLSEHPTIKHTKPLKSPILQAFRITPKGTHVIALHIVKTLIFLAKLGIIPII